MGRNSARKHIGRRQAVVEVKTWRPALFLRETPNNTSVTGGIGGCGIILDVGAAENGLRR